MSWALWLVLLTSGVQTDAHQVMQYSTRAECEREGTRIMEEMMKVYNNTANMELHLQPNQAVALECRVISDSRRR